MTEKQEDQLYDELGDLEMEILPKLNTLINAEWDSNTLKTQIESLMKQYNTVMYELGEILD